MNINNGKLPNFANAKGNSFELAILILFSPLLFYYLFLNLQ